MTYDELVNKISELGDAMKRLEKTICCVQDCNAKIMDSTTRWVLYDLEDVDLNALILEHLANERDSIEQRIATLCNLKDRVDEMIQAGESM